VLELVGFECEIILSARRRSARYPSARRPDLPGYPAGRRDNGEDILYQDRSNPRFDKTRGVITNRLPPAGEPITNWRTWWVKPIRDRPVEEPDAATGSLDFKSKFQMYRDPGDRVCLMKNFSDPARTGAGNAPNDDRFPFGVIAIEAHLEPEGDATIAPDVTLPILREIAGRLKKFVRPTDAGGQAAGVEVRHAGPRDLNEPEEIHVIVKRLSEKLTRPYRDRSKPYAAAV